MLQEVSKTNAVQPAVYNVCKFTAYMGSPKSKNTLSKRTKQIKENNLAYIKWKNGRSPGLKMSRHLDLPNNSAFRL